MSETLVQSLTVMFIGMGTVLAFLCTTIISMIIMAKVVKKINQIFPETVPQAAGVCKAPQAEDDANIAVAILSAILKK